MGTAHVLLHSIFVEKLSSYADQVTILESVPFDLDEFMFNVLVESPFLPEGYNGQQEMYLKEDKIHFRREADT